MARPMTSTLLTALSQLRVVPVVVIDDETIAGPLADALVAGGLPCAEVTFRTEAAPNAIRALSRRGDILVGAGTVVSASQVDLAVDCGARFIVSPGFGVDVVRRAQERGVLVIPGVATASELQAAVSAGLSAVKLFPSEQLGGLRMISALSAPFPDVRFMPSGGISVANAAAYLDHEAVFAVGGSWMVPRTLLANGDLDAVRELTRQTSTTLSLGTDQ
jgi:2-dehydro-3-deoxyphosphogluconate aldolase / (4S)-4-hydroxy-2-oxoglutarate aldolase